MNSLMTENAAKVIDRAREIAEENNHESYGVAHLAKALSENTVFSNAYRSAGGSEEDLCALLNGKVHTYQESKAPSDDMKDEYAALITGQILNKAKMALLAPKAGLTHLFLCIFGEYEPYFSGQDVLNSQNVSKDQLYQTLYDIEKDELRFKASDRDIVRDFMIASATLNVTMEKHNVGDEKNIRENLERKRVMANAGAQAVPEGKWQDFVTNLNQKMAGSTKPLIGRETEISRLCEILMKKNKSNPLEIGEAGVGKTAIVDEFARLISAGKVPTTLLDKVVFELNVTSLMAGTSYRGMLEARFNAVIDALKAMQGRAILYIDEIHMLMGTGSEGTMDIANMLKTELLNGDIKFIGSTTYDEYRKFISKDPAFQRRFNKIDINEPSVKDAKGILRGLKNYFEDFHKITYDDAALDAAVEMTDKFVHDRFLPDKAIDLIDEAGAWLKLHPENGTIVTEEMISDSLSKTCNISSKTMDAGSIKQLKELPKQLRKLVYGQTEAVNAVSGAIQIAKSGLGDDTKPVGAFLFVGPSGVGKTELAKQLAAELGSKLIRFDMSEYHDSHSSSKLFGTSAGFIGYENGGLLTNAVAKNPECVLLLDEIEKAHPDVYKTFLQILDYGILTDNHGKSVDFKNAVIIMTSNAGVSELDKPKIGFGADKADNSHVIDDAVNELFSVELRNRLTGIIKFNALSDEAAFAVINKELGILRDKAEKLGYNISFDKACKEEILKEGVSKEFGAREVQRVITEKVKKAIVSAMMDDILNQDSVVTFDGNSFMILKKESVEADVETVNA